MHKKGLIWTSPTPFSSVFSEEKIDVMHWPSIKRTPLSPNIRSLPLAIKKNDQKNYLCISSSFTLDCIVKEKVNLELINQKHQFIIVGQKTAQKAKRIGLNVIEAFNYGKEAIQWISENKPIFFSNIGADKLAFDYQANIQKLGIQYSHYVLYKTESIISDMSDRQLEFSSIAHTLLQFDQIVTCLTSPAGVRSWGDFYTKNPQIAAKTSFVGIGLTTQKALSSFGFSCDTPETPTLELLQEKALRQFFPDKY